MRRIVLLIVSALLLAPQAFAAEYADAAGSACLMNVVTGEVLFEKNSGERMPMASTTKIMTLLAALKETSQDEIVTVSAAAAAAEGSSAYIETGMRITMEALEYGLMLNSGNDAAVAIAEYVSGDCGSFAAEMNELAKEIGAENTNFMNPNGLDQEGHYTTAYDLALITRYAMRDESFRKIVSTKLYTAEFVRADGTQGSMEYINHNKLLGTLEGCTGVKTGYTKKAGRCLVSAAERSGAEYISVTLNDADDWKEHKELMELAFGDSRLINAVSAGDCLGHAVNGRRSCDLIAAEGFNVPVNGEGYHNIDIVPHIPDMDGVALNKGEKAGYIEILCNGRRAGCVDVVAKEDFAAGMGTAVKPCFLFTILTLIKNIL
ncbi:MAG: D-alanyl-D-alanine carboxypeptidase family protein [Candidatus Ornithomonoglobus sp.]